MGPMENGIMYIVLPVSTEQKKCHLFFLSSVALQMNVFKNYLVFRVTRKYILTFHAIREALFDSPVVVLIRNPVSEGALNAILSVRNSLELILSAHKSSTFHSSNVFWIGPGQIAVRKF